MLSYIRIKILFLVFSISICFVYVSSNPVQQNKVTQACENQSECKFLLTEELRNRQYDKRPTRKQLCEFCKITMPLVREFIKRNKTEKFKV